MVGIGVGEGSRRSGEEEAGVIGRRQYHALFAARLVTGGVCGWVWVCVCGLLDAAHPSGSGCCIGYKWALSDTGNKHDTPYETA